MGVTEEVSGLGRKNQAARVGHKRRQVPILPLRTRIRGAKHLKILTSLRERDQSASSFEVHNGDKERECWNCEEPLFRGTDVLISEDSVNSSRIHRGKLELEEEGIRQLSMTGG